MIYLIITVVLVVLALALVPVASYIWRGLTGAMD